MTAESASTRTRGLRRWAQNENKGASAGGAGIITKKQQKEYHGLLRAARWPALGGAVVPGHSSYEYYYE